LEIFGKRYLEIGIAKASGTVGEEKQLQFLLLFEGPFVSLSLSLSLSLSPSHFPPLPSYLSLTSWHTCAIIDRRGRRSQHWQTFFSNLILYQAKQSDI
jgi:hypothetical protein